MSQKTGNIRWLWLSIFIILLDQASKFIVAYYIYQGESIHVLPFLNLTVVYNTGAAFSFLHSESGWQQWLFGGIAIVICIIILFWLARTPRSRNWFAASLALIFGGALGNVIDRIHHGYVVDFIDFHVKHWHWPVFNVADSAVVIGVIIMFISSLRGTE